MKLNLHDSYNIRARLCPSIILLSPIPLTLFFCFKDIYNLVTSSILICVLMALTNYIPILQRYLCEGKISTINYAAQYLEPNDQTFDSTTKKRYYNKLAECNPCFSQLFHPNSNEELMNYCKSAVSYIRNRTRDNHLVLEENINHGFCKNMILNRPIGIILCIMLSLFSAPYCFLLAYFKKTIPLGAYVSIGSNILFLLFWIFGIKNEMLEQSAKKYAQTLIEAIDTL